MSNDNLNRLLLFCILCILLHRLCTAQGANDLTTKVALMLHVEPEDPKCFAEGRRDLTCFWEEDEEQVRSPDQYSFTYTYQSMNSSRCAVTARPAVGGKRLYFCRLSQTQFFAPLDIKVHRDGLLIHNRTLLVELVYLLDPPTNVTVVRAEQQGQLRVRWRPPSLKYMDNSMMYEVSYTAAGRRTGQVEKVKAGSELVLRGLQPGTRYKVQVRVKLDGISYNGYWSAWTKPSFMDTRPPDLDPLIVSLSLIIGVILTLLSLAALLSHRRFLLKKIWPVIPTPDSKFQDLFTVYGGDFQEWLGNSSGGLWLTPAFFYPDEVPAPLEVLSEVSLGPPLASSAPAALPPKTSAAPAHEAEGEDERRRGADERQGEEDEKRWGESGHDLWLMEQLQALHRHPAPPRSQSSLLESHDAYVTLDAGRPGGTAEEPLDDILEETLPLQVLFASGRSTSESRSDLGSLQQSSGSGRLSSQSSFEYPHHTWPSRGPGYIYMAVADSGVSMDYSPMSSSQTDLGKRPAYANEYKNEVPGAHRRPDILRGQPVHS